MTTATCPAPSDLLKLQNTLLIHLPNTPDLSSVTCIGRVVTAKRNSFGPCGVVNDALDICHRHLSFQDPPQIPSALP